MLCGLCNQAQGENRARKQMQDIPALRARGARRFREQLELKH